MRLIFICGTAEEFSEKTLRGKKMLWTRKKIANITIIANSFLFTVKSISQNLTFARGVYFLVFVKFIGVPGLIRTGDPLLRRQMLYPAELQGHSFTMVGALGFEPRTSWSQTKRASQLRYAPTNYNLYI